MRITYKLRNMRVRNTKKARLQLDAGFPVLFNLPTAYIPGICGPFDFALIRMRLFFL
jgi:hypothetical protein